MQHIALPSQQLISFSNYLLRKKEKKKLFNKSVEMVSGKEHSFSKHLYWYLLPDGSGLQQGSKGRKFLLRKDAK